MNTSHAAFNNAMPLTDPLALAKRRLFNPGFNLEFSGRSLAKHQDQVVQLCFDILDDQSLQDEDAPGGGCAPINAVRLLAAWKIDAAIPRLWRVIETPYCDDVLLDEILNALCEWGDAAVDALFPFTQTVAHNCRLLLGAILSNVSSG